MFPRISWSSLRRFEQCPQRYFLARKGLEAPIPCRVVVVGSAVHNAVQSFVQGHTFDPEAYASEDVRRLVDEARVRDEDYSVADTEVDGFAAEASRVAGVVVSAVSDRLARDSKFASEVSMNRYYGGWSLEGRIDLLERTPQNQLFLWDIKTGRSEPDPDQLRFYDVLARGVNVRPDTVGWLDRHGRFFEVVSGSDERAALRHRISRAVESIRADSFSFDGFPNECNRCRCNIVCPRMEVTRKAGHNKWKVVDLV